jgi:hypothetical protein
MKYLFSSTICLLLILSMSAQISIIGPATPANDWETDYNMTQDPENTDIWSITIALTSNYLKFRQDSNWTVNWGNSSFPTGTGIQDGPNIPVSIAGQYNVTFNTATFDYNFMLKSSEGMGISHQAIIRDAGNMLIANQQIGVRVSIIQYDAEGTIVYSETHAPISNTNGLISFVIGQGEVVSGDFNAIGWYDGSFFIKTETDPTGGSNYTIIGTTQLLSVPYAFYAEKSRDNPWIKNGIDIYFPEGNAGIGTSNPEQKLDLRGSDIDEGAALRIGNSDGSHRLLFFGGRENDPNPYINWKHGDPLRFATDDGGWSEKMRITSDGRVGIGTTNPLNTLHISGNDSVRAIFSAAGGFNNQTSAIILRSTFGGNIQDYTPRNLAMLKAHFDGGGWNTATLAFHTAGDDCITDGDAEPCERMRISSNGNVGIGTILPERKLHVTSDFSSWGLLRLQNTNPGQNEVSMSFLDGSNTSDSDIWLMGVGVYGKSGDFIIGRGGMGGQKLIIDYDGNVGIGALGPNVKLHIDGGNDISPGLGGYLVVGNVGATNIGIDDNEIMARNNGNVGDLNINREGGNIIMNQLGGNVGIGTYPSAKLHVNGTAKVNVLQIMGGADIAEPFDIVEEIYIKPGMVMTIDPKNPGKLKLSNKAYDRCVAGIVSGAGGINSGMIMGQTGSIADGAYPIALSGRVYCYAETSNGIIQPGDLITTSNIPGYAMKATNQNKAQGAIIGKAMTSLETRKGLILVLVSLQ